MPHRSRFRAQQHVAEEAAVRQAIARGELPKAQKFVAARSTGTRDTKQRVLEGLVDGASKGKQDVMVPTSGVGRIVGKTHYMNDEPTYLYCGTTSCTQVGKVGVEYRTVLGFYPTVTLDGEWWVKQGPRVDFTAAECVTRHDARALPDTTVHTWSNCPKAHNASTWTTRALVLAENWGGGGTKGEDYFMRYRLSFKTEAGSKPTFGPFEWETHRYKVSSSGGSADWHT